MKRFVFASMVCAFALSACSSVTLLRTKEMKAVGDDVKQDVQQVKQNVHSSAEQTRARIDSLESVIDSLALVQKRMKVELAMLSSKLSELSDRNDSHHEELLYRLDLLLGKSDKILSKKVVVNGQTVSAPQDSSEISAEKVQTLDSLFNTARADYHKGEIKLAYSEFKQIYEDAKKGQVAADALYWMGVCLADVNQMDKAKVVFGRVIKAFPESPKTCASLFKLSNIAAAEGDSKLQKQYLQKILGTKNCSDSNEFLQAAELLEMILDGETAGEPQPVRDSTKNATPDSSASVLPSANLTPLPSDSAAVPAK